MADLVHPHARSAHGPLPARLNLAGVVCGHGSRHGRRAERDAWKARLPRRRLARGEAAWGNAEPPRGAHRPPALRAAPMQGGSAVSSLAFFLSRGGTLIVVAEGDLVVATRVGEGDSPGLRRRSTRHRRLGDRRHRPQRLLWKACDSATWVRLGITGSLVVGITRRVVDAVPLGTSSSLRQVGWSIASGPALPVPCRV